MPRIRLLASSLALAICAITTAQAQEFTSFAAFGDSLSDAGNFGDAVGLPPGSSFTTNPDPVAVQIIASAFGFSVGPSGTGGSDYAEGSACVGPGLCESSEYPFLTIPTLQQQITSYLAANNGAADPHGLYSYWGGANDIFGNLNAVEAGTLNPALVPGNIAAVGQLSVAQITQLHNAGAGYIMVFNLPNIGITPDFAGGPFQATVTDLTLIYNNTLNAGLAGKTGIIPVNVFGLVNEVLANPLAYGFSNVTMPACTDAPGVTGAPSSVGCYPAGTPGAPYVYAPGTNLSYFFADGVHPTGAGHALLAQYVLAEIAAPSYVSMLAETPLQVFETQNRALHDQMEADMGDNRPDGSLRSFASVDYSHQNYDQTETSPEMTTRDDTLVMGADYHVSNSVSFGMSTTFSHQDANFGGGGGFENNEPMGAAWMMLHSSDFYVSALGSIGQLNFNGIDREIQLGTETRTEIANTDGSHLGAQLAGGYWFHFDDMKTGPFVSISHQRVRVGGYNEDGDDSTAMVFGRQNLDSTVSEVGWELTTDSKAFGGGIHPFARVAYDHESDADPRYITAGLTTMNGSFSLPGYQPDSSYWTAQLGLAAEISGNLSGYAAYSGHFGDSNERVNSMDVGVKWSW